MGVAQDRTVWFGGLEGLAQLSLDTEEWTFYNYPGAVNDLAIASDGSIWLAGGWDGPVVYHFIPSIYSEIGRDDWRIYDERDGIPNCDDSSVESVLIADDGAVWFGTDCAATRCFFPER